MLHAAFAYVLLAHAHHQKLTLQDDYRKIEAMIPMRDGVRLYTRILVPKADDGGRHPMMLMRTPYSCGPYGPDKMPGRIGGSDKFIQSRYIFVNQDVRGHYMSEGDFEDVRPQLQRHLKPEDIDESTDTYDTLDWLVKNVPANNGKVGAWGISYPGGYAALAAMSRHPALKAVSPQAPTADWFIGDDFHHHGVMFEQDVLSFYSGFGGPRTGPATGMVPAANLDIAGNAYTYFLNLGPLSNVNDKLFHHKVAFWDAVSQHPNYDEFWQARSMPDQLSNLKCALLNVGGWFDAEDAYGPQACYKRALALSPGSWDGLVLGPWYHGMWHSGQGEKFGRLDFGSNTSQFFMDDVEFPFFDSILNGSGKPSIPKVTVFQTGRNRWRQMDSWPPKSQAAEIFLAEDKKLWLEPGKDGEDAYTSDPSNPVPYQDGVLRGRTREYMIDDQTFASKRPDVLSYTQDVGQDVTVVGTAEPDLYIKSDTTDADFCVKLIDVWPDSDPVNPGMQQLVRGDIMRARFRDSYSNPKPLVPGEVAHITFKMDDIFHTFLKGHKIMVQIQSSWFPLAERSPQSFVDPFTATDSDFKTAHIEVLFGKAHPSGIRVGLDYKD